jgi:hypothetical protein
LNVATGTPITGGSNTSVNGVALSTAIHGYGAGGGGGAAHVTTAGNGAAGLGGIIRIYAVY